MRADEEAFVELVSADIKYFADKESSVGNGRKHSPSLKSVLLFPPVNNYRRFLIHKICGEHSSDLSHFSIGRGDVRRTVICFTADLVKSVPVPRKPTAMGIERYYTPPSASNKDTTEKKAKTVPAVGIYRPPPARRLHSEEASVASATTEKAKIKPRRPDLQVYVPRAKRASTSGCADSPIPTVSNRRHSANVPSTCHSVKLSDSNLEIQQSSLEPGLSANMSTFNTISPAPIISEDLMPHRFDSIVNQTSHVLPIQTLTAATDNELLNPAMHTTGAHICNEVISKDIVEDTASVDLTNSTQDDLVAVAYLSQQSSTSQEVTVSCKCDLLCDVKSENQVLNVDSVVDLVSAAKVAQKATDADCGDGNEVNVPEFNKCIQTVNDEEALNVEQCQVTKVSVPITVARLESCEQVRAPCETFCDVEIIANSGRLQKCEEDDEKCRISEEQNRKNRSIHRGNIYMSDILLISDGALPPPSTPVTAVLSNQSGTTHGKHKRVEPEINKSSCTSQAASKSSGVRLNPDECTWDMMFDENGDCLDPFLMDELTSKVGNVTIQTPQSDYKSFTTTSDFQPRDEFSHVVEIYDFPPEFKTQDLVSVFANYQSKGFEIKWVDDTHALGVFSNSIAANQVLKENHPFVKTRPLHEGSPESRAKARRSSEFLLPYRPRPETCPAMARRMVTGALGLRLSTAKQEREAERALLKLAREKKKLEARQKDDAWEGTLCGKVNSTD